MRKSYLLKICFTLILTIGVLLLYFYRIYYSTSNIPPPVKPHVEEFVSQALKRGIVVNPKGLTITFVNNLKDEEGKPAFGKYTRWSFPLPLDIIKLDTMGYWWKGSINRDSKEYIKYSREKVIFHELSHFLLNRREHKYDTFPGGLPKSIMGYGSLPSYEQYPDIRKYYLDELFNPDTPAPNWAKSEECATKDKSHQELNKVSNVSDEIIFDSFWESPSPVFNYDYIIIWLNKKVDESMLKKIALSLREKRECYYSLAITYFISGQANNTEPWATTNFIPELEIEIKGATADYQKVLF
ncbi:MAG: hypothetical protein M3Q05_01745 [Bacteroidota bacterium]|nr:hypothetical protein [Bacteroidota bacterium]